MNLVWIYYHYHEWISYLYHEYCKEKMRCYIAL
jgi:hypothetical protein